MGGTLMGIPSKKSSKKTEKKKTAPAKGGASTQGGVAPAPPEKELGNDWYVQGDQGFEIKKRIDVAAKIRKEKSVSRFMLKAEEEADIVFVDSVPFFISEHNVAIDGKWGNYLTCTKEVRVCAVCNKSLKSTFTAYLTIIDRRQFVRKSDGTLVKDRKILYPAKGSTIARIEDLRKKYGSLTGLVFHVKRYTKDDPNCGSDLQYVKKVTLTGDNAKPHDYRKIFYPPTEDELQALGFKEKVVGQTENKSTPSNEGNAVNQQADKLDEIL
jgi:hypothetical protein